MTTSTIAQLNRTSQAYCNQLCEKETLDHGIAYYCPRYPTATELNQFREVVLPDEATCQTAFEQARALFDSHRIVCGRWAAAYDQPAAPWTAFLASLGFTARRFTAMRLTTWPNIAPDPSIRVLPARAMRDALRQTVVHADASDCRPRPDQRAEILNERLDDAAFDAFVAIAAGVPAGRCALYQVGDIARVMEFEVLPTFADSAIGEALLGNVLALARRLMMHSICACIDSENTAMHALLTRFGFIDDGAYVEMELPSKPNAGTGEP